MGLSQGKMLALAAGGALLVAAVIYALSGSSQGGAAGQQGSQAQGGAAGAGGGQESSPTSKGQQKSETIEPPYPVDPTDARSLMGYSENVFVGTVEEHDGDEPMKTSDPKWSWPQAQYRIDVLESIKSGGKEPVGGGESVTVNQLGGVDKKSGKTYVVVAHSGDPSETTSGVQGLGQAKGHEGTGEKDEDHLMDQPLIVGKRYLLATRYDKQQNLQTISVQPTGDVPLDDNPEGDATLSLYRKAAKDPVDPLKNGKVAA